MSCCTTILLQQLDIAQHLKPLAMWLENLEHQYLQNASVHKMMSSLLSHLKLQFHVLRGHEQSGFTRSKACSVLVPTLQLFLELV